MGRTVDGDNHSPLVRFEISFRKVAPHLHQLIGGNGRYRYRELSVIYRGPGDYLGKVKALDTAECRPVIAFAAASTYEAALVRLDVAVAGDRWKPDRFARESWAR